MKRNVIKGGKYYTVEAAAQLFTTTTKKFIKGPFLRSGSGSVQKIPYPDPKHIGTGTGTTNKRDSRE
jgi:hypothetical protein